MDLNLQQRTCIKFCVKNKLSGVKTLSMLKKCFGDDTLKKTVIYQWHGRFRNGRELVTDDERSGRPLTSKTDENIDKVKEIIINNGNQTVRKLAEELNIAYGSVQDILVNDLSLRNIAGKLVPKELNAIQKRDRIDIADDMISKVESDPSFIRRIITGDEIWIYENDQDESKKPRSFQEKKKIILIVFMDYNGIVHYEFVPEGQAVSKDYYLGVLRRLCEEIQQKRIALFENNSWILHHNNAPSRNAIIIRDFLTINGIKTIQHPQNSPDLSPCDFFLFTRVKKPLSGVEFSREEILEKSKVLLMKITKGEFKKGFEDWINRWRKCIAVNGDYFEGDNSNLVE